MKAISMWQPWASLWLTDAKLHETRGRALYHRGWLLVHAAKRIEPIPDGEPLARICGDRLGPHWRTALPRGAIIGAVNIVDCHTTEFLLRKWCPDGGPVSIAHWEGYQCGNYGPKRYGIERGPVVKTFAEPIPYRGMQAVPFEVPDDIVREALAA